MLKEQRGAALGLALFAGLAAFGIWTEISSQHSPASQTPRRGDENAKTEIRPQSPDETIALYTEVLAWFTGILAFVSALQITFLIRADRTARTSADAARLAAEALPKIERAYVFAEVILKMIVNGGSLFEIDICFRNHGKTPALISRIRCYPVLSTEPPRRLSDFPGSTNRLPQGLVIKADGVYWENIPKQLTTEETVKVHAQTETLFCVGEIEYLDILGKQHVTGFCWHFFQDSRGYGFTISPNTELNYHT
jgi:hypothetical protein